MTTAALSSERRTISVVQYNVLAEGLSNPAMSPDAGFTSMPPEQMRWAHRGELVLDRLIRANADIVCLQEVDHYHDSVEPAMRAAGYAGLYREDEWSPCRANTNGALKDGVALFYRRSKLELVGCHFPFAPRESKDPSHARAHADAGKSVAARFRVLCAEPEIASGPRFGEYVNATETFIACTAHFAAAKTEEGETRRTRQASALFRELKRFRAFCEGEDSFDVGEGRTTDSRARVRARDIPIVFAGDLNARPDEPAVRYLKTLGFASAYERVLGSEPAFTTWKIRTGAFKPGEAKMCIDYVFASPRAKIRDVSALPSERDVGENALPCDTHPSDHLMLRAELVLPSADDP